MSQVTLDPDIAAELFFLAPDEPGPPADGGRAAGSGTRPAGWTGAEDGG